MVDATATNSNRFAARPNFVVFTDDALQLQAIRGEASTMRRFGMSPRAIGAALGVDEKKVRKALAGLAS